MPAPIQRLLRQGSRVRAPLNARDHKKSFRKLARASIIPSRPKQNKKKSEENSREINGYGRFVRVEDKLKKYANSARTGNPARNSVFCLSFRFPAAPAREISAGLTKICAQAPNTPTERPMILKRIFEDDGFSDFFEPDFRRRCGAAGSGRTLAGRRILANSNSPNAARMSRADIMVTREEARAVQSVKSAMRHNVPARSD